MNERLEILREELCELHRENEELKDEVSYLQEELDNANEILDDIEAVLFSELDDIKLIERIYNKIFHIK